MLQKWNTALNDIRNFRPSKFQLDQLINVPNKSKSPIQFRHKIISNLGKIKCLKDILNKGAQDYFANEEINVSKSIN